MRPFSFRLQLAIAVLALCACSCATQRLFASASGPAPGASAQDPDPTESITPLSRSAATSIVNDPPCEECDVLECPYGGCPLIEFDRVARAMPEVRDDEQPIHFENECSSLLFRLEPVVLEAHLTATRTVMCMCSREDYDCELVTRREVFETDPHKSIPLSDTVTVAEALEILAFFNQRKVVDAPEDLFNSEGIAGIYRNGSNFELYLANCGENALVKLERSWKGRQLRYIKGVHGSGCV